LRSAAPPPPPPPQLQAASWTCEDQALQVRAFGATLGERVGRQRESARARLGPFGREKSLRLMEMTSSWRKHFLAGWRRKWPSAWVQRAIREGRAGRFGPLDRMVAPLANWRRQV